MSLVPVSSAFMKMLSTMPTASDISSPPISRMLPDSRRIRRKRLVGPPRCWVNSETDMGAIYYSGWVPRFPRLSPALAVTMLLWGFNFIALKLVLREMTPNALALVRTVLAYALLLPICWFRGISLRYPAGEAWRVLLQGALAMGIYVVIFFRGMQGSTPAEGAIILGTSPAFTLLIALLVKQERFRIQALVGIAIAFAGVVLVVLSGPVSHAYSVSPS